MVALIDEQRGTHGVEPICRQLPIAPFGREPFHVEVVHLVIEKIGGGKPCTRSRKFMPFLIA